LSRVVKSLLRIANCELRLALLYALVLISLTSFAQDKHLSVYAPQTYYTVSVVDRPAGPYVGLLDVLEPLGKVEARSDGKKWKLRFTPNKTVIESEFQVGKRTGKVRGAEFDLGAEFFMQADRGYVALASLPNLLPRLLERTVEMHAAGRRLFLSGAGIKYTLELRHNPTRLIATFPVPVSPSIASDGNRVRLSFGRDAVKSSGTDSVSYSEAPFSSANFTESNGSAVLEANGTVPLQAANSEGGRVITISARPTAAPAAAPATAQIPKPETPLPPPNIPAAAPGPTRSPGGRRTNLIVIDPGHGGEERGAQLTETLNEKDVTLALARRIQHELENRGFSVTLLRSGDSTMTFDQRASAANTSRAEIYLGIHAATLGTGLRVYTALLPPAPPANRRTFLPWDTAQAPFLDQSNTVAAGIAGECSGRKIPVRSMSAALRPLNNIAGAAVAVEIAPEGDSVESINDAKYQQNVASAVAAGIAAVRGKLESQ
jgi:N-acetylmuramoyl-L-alanine amidase